MILHYLLNSHKRTLVWDGCSTISILLTSGIKNGIIAASIIYRHNYISIFISKRFHISQIVFSRKIEHKFSSQNLERRGLRGDHPIPNVINDGIAALVGEKFSVLCLCSEFQTAFVVKFRKWSAN